MTRTTRLALVLAVAALAATACTGSGGDAGPSRPDPDLLRPPSAAPAAAVVPGEGTLRLVAPAGYVESGKTDPAADWVTDFTKATGCEVAVTVADTPDETARLLATGAYDGVAATGDVALRLVDKGRVAPVNTALVPNYVDVVPGLKDQPWNTVAGVAYGVPHGRAADLLMWRTDRVSPAPTSWKVVYDPAAGYAGKVTAYDSPMTLAGAAVYLRATRPDLGVTDPYALTPAQLSAATALARTQRGLVTGYWRDYSQEVPAFTSGSVVVGSTTRAIVDLAKAGKAPVEATVPAEGTTGTATTWMLAAKAAHPGCMYRWMDHVLSPAVNARAAEWLGIAPATANACARTTDRTWCTTHHATDEAYWAKVALATAPLKDCRDGRGTTCTDYAAWRKAWQAVVR